MRQHLTGWAALAALVLAAGVAEASWIFAPSYFSHDPQSGARAAQYTPEEAAYARTDPTFMRSGYRHNRASLRGGGGSADRLHVVETWGAGESIRPYGEWQRPFRAGATPYGPWGNPQGPWTSPYGAWTNPYGLGRIPNVHEFRYPDRQPYGGGPHPSPHDRPHGEHHGPGGG